MGKTWVLEKHVARWPDSVKKIPGCYGYYMVITHKKFHTAFDTFACGVDCLPGATVLTTSRHDNIVSLKPWRCKKDGEPYGAEWVNCRTQDGKRKYFKLEKLALELFGDKWLTVKAKISLEDLF